MNPIFAALANGYSEEEVLNFVINKIPKLAPRIKKAKKQGYTTNNILEFISSGMEQEANDEIMSSNQILAKNKKRQEEISKSLVKEGLKLGSMAFGAGMVSRIAPKLLSRLPGLSKFIGRTIGAEVEGGSAIARKATAPVAEALGAAEEVPAVGAVADPAKFYKIFQDRRQDAIIDALATQVEPEQGVTALQKLYGKNFLKELETQYKKPAEQIIGEAFEFARQKAAAPAKAQEEQPKEIDQPLEFPKLDAKTGKKGDIVATENGEVGTVKGISANHALIEVDGKTKKVPISSLIAEPETIKDAELVLNFSDVPENARSGALGIVRTSKDRKNIMISYGMTDDFYVFKRKDGKPFDQDLISKLQVGQTKPRTKGYTYQGWWDPEVEDSRGSIAYSELREKSQSVDDEEDDPTKEILVETMDNTFTHGFREKFSDIIKETSSAFSRKRKPKKKKK